MGIRSSFQTAGDRAVGPLLDDDVTAVEHRRASRNAPDSLVEGVDQLDQAAPAVRPITEILRGLDLDAMLHGSDARDFLYGAWADELSFGEARPTERFTDVQFLFGKEADTALVLPGLPDDSSKAKDADIAQVLPGVTADEFLLSRDADLPLILPGDEEGAFDGLEYRVPEVLTGFPTHMLTLDGEGGFEGGTDDIGRLHDHDGWLF